MSDRERKGRCDILFVYNSCQHIGWQNGREAEKRTKAAKCTFDFFVLSCLSLRFGPLFIYITQSVKCDRLPEVRHDLDKRLSLPFFSFSCARQQIKIPKVQNATTTLLSFSHSFLLVMFPLTIDGTQPLPSCIFLHVFVVLYFLYSFFSRHPLRLAMPRCVLEEAVRRHRRVAA